MWTPIAATALALAVMIGAFGAHALGAVTPLGGVSFIAAWLLLAYAAAKPHR